MHQGLKAYKLYINDDPELPLTYFTEISYLVSLWSEFRCARCLGTARVFDGREVSEVEVGNEKLEVVLMFCYLGDMLSAGGGCELAAITRCKCAWDKFCQLLPLLPSRHLSLLTRGKVYSSCVRSVMLHATETWAMKVDTLNHLRRNDRAMILCI